MADTKWPSLVPCSTCPWRRSSTVGGTDIPGFSIDLMRSLSCTVRQEDDFQEDAFRPIMSCHKMTPEDDRPCVGYLARHGWTNLAVRVHAMNGDIPMPDIMDACEDLDLWPDFETMLAAYEEAQ